MITQDINEVVTALREHRHLNSDGADIQTPPKSTEAQRRKNEARHIIEDMELQKLVDNGDPVGYLLTEATYSSEEFKARCRKGKTNWLINIKEQNK